jgi:hypothetical protein
LAQDVEKAMPGSTARVNGILSMSRGTLAAATPSIAMHPSFSGNQSAVRAALTNPRAGARAGGLANTKRRMPMGALSGA